MILPDHEISFALLSGAIRCEPLPPNLNLAIQPASLEVRLDWEWEKLTGRGTGPVYSRSLLCLEPGEFVLAHTIETITLPPHIAAQLTGKSSLGRLGLQVHSTAGFVDPGFSGQIVLELANLSRNPIALTYAQPVAQLVFHRLESPARRPYGHPDLGSHYQNQKGTTPSYLEAAP